MTDSVCLIDYDTFDVSTRDYFSWLWHAAMTLSCLDPISLWSELCN